MKTKNGYTAETAQAAMDVMRSLRHIVDELIEAENDEELARLSESMTPYAEIVAEVEGHGDVFLVLERELEL